MLTHRTVYTRLATETLRANMVSNKNVAANCEQRQYKSGKMGCKNGMERLESRLSHGNHIDLGTEMRIVAI